MHHRTPPPPPPRTPTRSLTGVDAGLWLADLGWTPEDGVDALRIAGAALHQPGFAVARVWSTPGVQRLLPDDDALALLVPTEGGVELVVEGRARSLEPNAVALLDPRRPTQLRSDRPAARVEVRTRRERCRRWSSSATAAPVSVEGAPHYRSLLLSVVGAVLDGSFGPADPGFPLVRECVESAVAALLAELAPRETAPSGENGDPR